MALRRGWLILLLLFGTLPAVALLVQPAEAAPVRKRTAWAQRRLAQHYLGLAQRALAAGHYKEAIEAFQRSFRLRPSAMVLMALGQCYELAGELDQARTIYERLERDKNANVNRALIKKRLDAIARRMLAPTEPKTKHPKPEPEPEPPPKVVLPPTDTTVADAGEDKTEDLIGEKGSEGGGGEGGGGGGGGATFSVAEVSGLISGWYRNRLDFYVAPDRALGATDIRQYALEVRNQMLLRLDVRYGAHLHGFASAFLEHILREEPPDTGNFYLFNGRTLQSEFNASVVETYLAVSWEKVEVRAGMLRVPWGKSDYISPNDVVNARDLRDPLLADLETLRIPVPAAELGLHFGPLSIEALWQPFATFDRMSLYHNNFGIAGPMVPGPIRGLIRFADRSFDSSISSRVEQVLMSTKTPPDNLTASAGGLRLGLRAGGFDFDLYYHYGWDSSPRLVMNPVVPPMLATIDWSAVKMQDLTVLLAMMDAGQTIYTSTYVRRHHAGADVATAIGQFSLRGEVGFDSDRVFYDPQLISYVVPAIAANVGAEYQISLEKMFLLEVNYLHAFNTSTPLLFYDRDSISIGAMARWAFFKDKLQAEVRGVIGVKPWSYIVRPQVSYKVSRRWSVYVGGLILGGSDRAIGGYFGRNDLVLVGSTCSI
jgi:tetratricopeptide (TPR) repeat protein